MIALLLLFATQSSASKHFRVFIEAEGFSENVPVLVNPSMTWDSFLLRLQDKLLLHEWTVDNLKLFRHSDSTPITGISDLLEGEAFILKHSPPSTSLQPSSVPETEIDRTSAPIPRALYGGLTEVEYKDAANRIGLFTYSSIIQDSIEEDVVQLSWSPRVYVIKNFLTKQACDAIIAANLDNLTTAFIQESTYDPKSRKNQNTFLNEQQEAEQWPVRPLKRRLSQLLHYPLENFENLQVARYRETDFYRPHLDATQAVRSNPRAATVLIYLNTLQEDQGGYTIFPFASATHGNRPGWQMTDARREDWSTTQFPKHCKPDSTIVKVKPEAGTALIFFPLLPSGNVDSMSVHASCPIIGANVTKWVAQQWIHVDALTMWSVQDMLGSWLAHQGVANLLPVSLWRMQDISGRPDGLPLQVHVLPNNEGSLLCTDPAAGPEFANAIRKSRGFTLSVWVRLALPMHLNGGGPAGADPNRPPIKLPIFQFANHILYHNSSFTKSYSFPGRSGHNNTNTTTTVNDNNENENDGSGESNNNNNNNNKNKKQRERSCCNFAVWLDQKRGKYMFSGPEKNRAKSGRNPTGEEGPVLESVSQAVPAGQKPPVAEVGKWMQLTLLHLSFLSEHPHSTSVVDPNGYYKYRTVLHLEGVPIRSISGRLQIPQYKRKRAPDAEWETSQICMGPFVEEMATSSGAAPGQYALAPGVTLEHLHLYGRGIARLEEFVATRQ